MSTTIDASTNASLASSATTRTETATRSGKSGQAIGHLAKQAVAEAGAGTDLPKNVQGRVASALARGLPLDSILALQPSPSEPGPQASTDVSGAAAAAASPDATDTIATGAQAPGGASPDDASALELLGDGDEPAP